MAGAPLTIRRMTGADRADLWPLLEPVFRAGETYAVPRDITPEAALDYWCGGNHSVWLAETDGVLLGSYFICPNQQGGGAHVCNCGFVTAEAARGRGVARAMLAHALDTAVATGYRAMQFNFVVETNTVALALWQASGFDIVGRLKDAFLHPVRGYVDALVLYRSLV